MAFALHSDLAVRLGVTFTDDEETDATALIALAEALIQSETGQTISAVAADVLTRPGVWADRLRLPERPVTGVDSVTLDGVALTETDEWYLDGDELVRASALGSGEQGFQIRSGPSWGGPEATLVITYDHGYSTIPGVVKAVTLEMCVRCWVNPGSVRQEGYGSEQVSYGDAGLMLTDSERRAVLRSVGRTAGTVTLR